MILLLDPVPLLKKTLHGPRRALEHEIVDLKGPRREKSNCKSRTAPDSTFGRDAYAYQYELRSPFTQARPRTPWTLNYSNLFSNDIVQELDYQLYPFRSTKDAFERWLLSAGPDHVASYANRLGPASMMFRIAYQDTLGLLQIMRVAITEISRASSDNVLQERALHWRYRLDQFRAQLMELQESLQQFADYVRYPAFPHTSSYRLEKSPIEFLRSDALNQISVLNSRIEQAYASLTSKVQISDSHRSIAEAETVTRLTELAFLFIPLSFATSIFGMQIIDSSTPFSIYIAVALALTSVVYVLRFFVHRSTQHRNALARSIKSSITSYARLRPGSRIPTTLFFRWLLWYLTAYTTRYWRLSLLGATTLVMVVLPLPILWAKKLDPGLSTAVSVLFISIPGGLVLCYILVRYGRGKRLLQLATPVTTPSQRSVQLEP